MGREWGRRLNKIQQATRWGALPNPFDLFPQVTFFFWTIWPCRALYITSPCPEVLKNNSLGSTVMGMGPREGEVSTFIGSSFLHLSWGQGDLLLLIQWTSLPTCFLQPLFLTKLFLTWSGKSQVTHKLYSEIDDAHFWQQNLSFCLLSGFLMISQRLRIVI